MIRRAEPQTKAIKYLSDLLLIVQIAETKLQPRDEPPVLFENNIEQLLSKNEARYIIAHLNPSLYEVIYSRSNDNSDEDIARMLQWKEQMIAVNQSLARRGHQEFTQAISQHIEQYRHHWQGKVETVFQWLARHGQIIEKDGHYFEFPARGIC